MSPTVLRTCTAIAFVGAFLFLAACQDPSGVGLGVIGEEGTDPNVSVVAVDMLELREQDDFTGGFARSLSPVQSRILVGAATDPLLGNASAFAYADFIPPDVIPEGYLDRNIISATLRLVRNYAYGDSTVTVPLQVYQMEEAWIPIGAPSDSSFAVGDLLVETMVTASDSVHTLSLPSSWVSTYNEILRSDSVATAIDGFQVRLPDGAVPGVVMGFDTAMSSLRVLTAQDTVDYPFFEVFTHVEREDAPPPPPNRFVLRGGVGETLSLAFSLEDFANLPIANATLRLTVDPQYLSEPGFGRSIPESLTLYGRTTDDNRLSIMNASFDEATNSFAFSSATLTAVIQETLVGDSIIESLELSVTASPASMSALPLIIGPEPAEGEADTRPRFALTIIPRPS